ncbi:MAG: polysaccharide biosynthesis/export family protein [Candidatus Brocadiaceae bacterium]|nr:polysaccharide biosynthesis/export family protein [Candidatus Brocadiaceae bacterium]
MDKAFGRPQIIIWLRSCCLLICAGIILSLAEPSNGNGNSRNDVKPGHPTQGPKPAHFERTISADYLENDYIIGQEDILDIKIFGATEFDRKVRVSTSGHITFPHLGSIKAEGLTVADLEFTIAGLLAEKYLKDPQVSIYIEEFNSKKVIVVGEVKGAKVLKLHRNSSTLFEVLGEVGGINNDAGKMAYVIRSTPAQAVASNNYPSSGSQQASPSTSGIPTSSPSNDDEKVMVQMRDTIIPVNINELLEYRNPMTNIEILPGDIVTVPRGQLFFIMGEVEKPGAYSLTGGLTSLQALSMGGKFSSTYKPSDIKLVRRESGGSTTFTTLNFKKMAKGDEDDVEVQPGDIFIVGKSPAKTIALQSLGLTKVAMDAFTVAFAYRTINK